MRLKFPSLFFVFLLTSSATAFSLSSSSSSSQLQQQRQSSPSPLFALTDWERPDLFGDSLIPTTLKEIEEENEEHNKQQSNKEERAKIRRSLKDLSVPNFAKHIETPLQRKSPTVLQLNVGLFCNQACSHCHVESSPLKTEEQMNAETAAQCLQLLKASPSITTLDLTGGAPELNQHFRFLVEMARQIRPDLEIIDRCNLTVLQEPGQEDLVDFLVKNRVRVVASLPCYSLENVNQQRGRGVFERSIAALVKLNKAGYGRENDGNNNNDDLKLDLVYNPLGAFLPPDQAQLEVAYKRELKENFGIEFNSLLAFTNMPIRRFADFLVQNNELQAYMDLLVQNYNANTKENLMCLDTISVGWDGQLYDCDFNQQLGLGLSKKLTVFDLEELGELRDRPIRTDHHCFACTAGKGSS